MAKRLTGGSGTGKKILKYWDDFNFDLERIEDSTYLFKIRFFNQEGYMNIKYLDGDIKEITMNCNFDRPLGYYNDSSLGLVGMRMMNTLK